MVLATPLSTHYALGMRALAAGKHLFIEKPLAATVDQGLELVRLARKNRRVLMVGHIFLFNAGIRFVKSLIASEKLGQILFMHVQRTNLGPVRQDANALWDLAAHDISIINYLLDDRPVRVTASGSRLLNRSIEDVVSASFFYGNDLCCSMLSSWIHPQKVRQITIVGEKKMVVWDDMMPRKPLRIYNTGIAGMKMKEQVEGTLAEFNFSIAEGNIKIPKIQLFEPLKEECAHFVDCVVNDKNPLSDARMGLDVVCALSGADRSMANGSRLEAIGYPSDG